jgi:predicted nucleic acid-binding protein
LILRIHLDTGFFIRALVSGSPEAKKLSDWIREGSTIGISAIAWTEFACGPLDEQAIELAVQLLGEPAGFSRSHAELAASLFNSSGRRRGTLVDCMIAATAIAAEAALATTNREDFERFDRAGLTVLCA